MSAIDASGERRLLCAPRFSSAFSQKTALFPFLDLFSSVQMLPPATEILLQSLANNRLPHAILLYGEDIGTLQNACDTIAARLLETQPHKLAVHPDRLFLRPSNKSRRIPIDEVRDTVRQIQQTACIGKRKVAIILEAERMASDAADTFLKTLEEPPADTTLFLLTTKRTHVRQTILSRTLHFHVPPASPPPPDPAWEEWLFALDNWICSLASPARNTTQHIASLIFTLYGLAARFDKLLKTAASVEWKKQEEETESLDKEQKEALQLGILKNIRAARYADMENRLCAIHARAPSLARTNALHTSILELERSDRLLATNFNEIAALESALLQWMRAWHAK
jgi:DNA polymerase-3 subunit delta'